MASAPVPPAAPGFMDEQAVNLLMQDLAAVASMPPAVGRLVQDPAFIAAVKAGDVQTAAQVSWQFYQQVVDDRENGTAMWQTPYEPGQLGSRTATNKRFRDYEDDGRKDFRPASRTFTGPGANTPHGFQLSGPSARNKSLDRRPTAIPGDFSPDTDEGMPRPPRKHHFEGYQRPPTIGQPLPPAKVSTLLGRGVSKARDVCKAVRAELLSLEDAIPWDCVEAGWKARRAAWRKNLKLMDLQKAADTLISPLAAALQELTAALLLQKQDQGAPQPPPAPGQATPTTVPATASAAVAVLSKGGAWDALLQELASGGNNYAALQHVWDEFHEAIRCWLHSQGHALPPPPQPPASPPYHHHHHTHSHSHHHHHHHHHQPPVPYAPLQSLPRCFDKPAFAVVCKAVEALHAGVSSTSPDMPVGQVVADRVVALSRDSAAALHSLLAQAEEVNLGSALEAVAAACELGPLLGVPAPELDRMSDAEVLLLLLCSPALRGDLYALCVTGIDGEPDTDVDECGDITDMELSD